MKKKSGFVDSRFIVRSYDFFLLNGHSTTKYVDQILTHFDLPPPRVDIQSIPYQMNPCRLSTDLLHLVHVVIECPLTAYPKKKFPFKKKNKMKISRYLTICFHIYSICNFRWWSHWCWQILDETEQCSSWTILCFTQFPGFNTIH